MMKRILALALFVPGVALAQDNEVSYDYFDFDYLASTWDLAGPGDDSSGFGAKFSIDFSSRYFMFGDYHAWEMDDPVVGDPGSVAKTIGLGKAGKFGQRWSLYGGVGFRSLDLDVGTGNMQEEGAVVIGGARLRFADTFEVRVGAEYADVVSTAMSGIIGEASVIAGFDLHMTDVAAITMEIKENEENVTSWSVGIRFYPTKETNQLRQRR
ncbi:MAG TPA: hypothetical protein VIC71_14090 [Gammaproteobacteria bacterium]